MGKPYSDDLRVRVVLAMEAGGNCRRVGAAFAIAPSTAGNWYRRYRQTQSYSAHPMGGDLPEIVERWRHELQEILVHSFDFLYFHQGDPEYYIKSIWHSWCAIPGISDRVPEYLMRTLCAVSANLLSEKPGTRFAAALENTSVYLEKIKGEV